MADGDLVLLYPTVTITGGGGTGPAGASYTTDDAGTLAVAVTTNETALTPTEAQQFDLIVSSAEAAAAPTEAQQFDAVLAAAGETAAAPTEGRSTAVLVGATTVTQTVGTGWTNPANAAGLANGTLATAQSTNTTAATGTLVGSYANILAAGAQDIQTGTVTLTWTYSLSLATLTTGSLALAYATDGGTNYTTLATITANTNGLVSTSFTITGVTLATLANLRFRVVGSVVGSAIGGTSNCNLDAVVAAFTATGN